MNKVSDQGVPLPYEQAVMLWCIRVWVIGLHHDIGATTKIVDLMESIGADDAASYLDGFMFALSHGAKRRIAVHCACHRQVESDERFLLDLLSLTLGEMAGPCAVTLH